MVRPKLEPAPVRPIVSVFLACLLLACPLLCRAAESECSHELSGTTSGPQDGSHIPPSCPDDGVSCICAGATQTGEFRATDLASPDLLASLDSWLLFPPTSPTLDVTRCPTREDPPAGLAVFGDALAVRAYLQNFRF
jgi:hypothetical protein